MAPGKAGQGNHSFPFLRDNNGSRETPVKMGGGDVVFTELTFTCKYMCEEWGLRIFSYCKSEK